jgi:hypothetical protein
LEPTKLKYTPGDLVDRVQCQLWAKKIWNDLHFSHRSAVRGEPTILARQKATSVKVRVLEWNSPWREQPHDTLPDKRVSAINWLVIVVEQPLLVEVAQSGWPTLRLLITTDAPRIIDEKGRVRWSNLQVDFMMHERIRTTIGCGNDQAWKLNDAVKDKFSLQIIEFAAFLLRKYSYRAQDTKATLGKLWSFTPEQICSAIPSRFHRLAKTDRHDKILKDLQKCIKLLTPRGK